MRGLAVGHRAGALQLALAQVVVGGAHHRSLAELEGIVAAGELVGDAAVLAHLDAVDLPALAEHRVLAGELVGDALDGLAHAEGLAAADALEGLVLVQGHRAHRRIGEVDARLERDDLLGAGDAAAAALHADRKRKTTKKKKKKNKKKK